MDFIGILQQAQDIQRETKNVTPVRRYSTALPAPKKMPKPIVKTEALKKYFEKKEQEEKEKLAEKLEKKANLLELRSQDKKSNRRVQAMLKRTKAASKAVLEGGADSEEELPDSSTYQPDEDDYGYVSQTASEMHKKLLSKYNMTNVERHVIKPKNDGDLERVKRRVNDSLSKEMEEEAIPGRRRRKKKSQDATSEPEPVAIKENQTRVEKEKPKKEKTEKDKNVIVRPKVTQPTMSFQDIIKLAQVKQFEPIKAEPKKPVKDAEFERPMTEKEKKEYLAERDRKLRREGKLPPIPKVEKKPEIKTEDMPSAQDESKKSSSTANIKPQPSSKVKVDLPKDKEKLSTPRLKEEKSVPAPSSVRPKEIPPKDLAPKQFHPRDLAPKQFPPKDLIKKPSANPSSSQKQRMNRDYRDNSSSRKPAKRQRFVESDEEYDSELDDFIDDEPVGEESAISREIQAIFGSRYRRYEPEDDDSDECMEVGFGQVEKEEMRSLRAGIKEDLEDIERELMMKKKKSVPQKRR
ncbi:protein SPT2 homolog [Artemia franciscana]|uniref:Protein SPT2 homolog n=1 Tax=Artemia franciscana TaxID=6661 RepID=A0AA88HSH8_ARTSF|nr:hypothetical protein QYM36_008808 [Artemia franciscana]